MKRQFRGSSKPALAAKLLVGQTLDTVVKLQPDCLGLPLGAPAIFFLSPRFGPFPSLNGGVGDCPHFYVEWLLGGQTLDIVQKLQPDCLGLPLGALAIFFSAPFVVPFPS